ncbi:MAG: bifunctional phosphopantothenoylcysteine decarboxylase/phosphopantothenate--cysteine ligase CoaBC [Candidatus Eisenbacteria bacterium]|nr:bifunctional phosphopantothenoylcysteine decarboxylase/phosphopantothenate--cysteine ligase CoaBC [Candidatus Eisenbacteria bacterium]
MRISGKKILIGVTGGVAAYKALETARLLVKEGALCQAVLTKDAARLVRPESFEAITGRKAACDLWEDERAFRPAVPFGPESRPIHIALAQDADLFLVAPATANVMAKMAAGVADDLLTTAYLAATCPVVVAPAMNKFMWLHPATQRNEERLRRDGVHIVDPDEGELACGYEGVGRLASPERIVRFVTDILSPDGELAGKKILITAGRTEEPIDPVRVITNRSSGRMGVALARAGLRRGAEVVFLSGALSVPPPEGIWLVDTPTAERMTKATLDIGPSCDVVVMAAAVGDYRPKKVETEKVKRSGPRTLELEPTRDILAALSGSRGSIRVLVGFALEMNEEEQRAREKLERKGLDLIVANRPEVPEGGIGKDSTEAILIGKDGFREEVPLSSKDVLAERIMDRVAYLLRNANAG